MKIYSWKSILWIWTCKYHDWSTKHFETLEANCAKFRLSSVKRLSKAWRYDVINNVVWHGEYLCANAYTVYFSSKKKRRNFRSAATWNASFHAYFYIPACFLKGSPDRVAAYLEQAISTNHIPRSFLLKVTRYVLETFHIALISAMQKLISQKLIKIIKN